MKVCKYCGAVNAENSSECSACGGREFKYKCENCGTEFDDGLYCPKCGVKAGTRAKVCPSCGEKYFSNACPNCGYTANRANYNNTYNANYGNANPQRNVSEPSAPVYTNQNTNQAPKRKTWLWVLGWIFCFPIPLTVLIVKNKKMSKVVKGVLIALLWLAVIIIGNSEDSQNAENVQTTSCIEVSVEETGLELQV